MPIENSLEIFKPVFGASWNQLPPVLKKHYANHAFSEETGIAEGKLDINFNKIFQIFVPIFHLLKILTPYKGKDVPTVVKFVSKLNSSAFIFEREFYFLGKNPIKFSSKMFPLKKNEIVEVMKCGIGWHCACSYENNKVLLRHRGYALKLFNFFIPLPLTFLIGTVSAEEEAISDDEFRMKMSVQHFLFGELYGYGGTFKMVKNIR